MRATDIVGYTYRADTYCPGCIIDVMVQARELSPAARDMDPEDALEQHADASAIDRMDEHSFDSGDFPKVIFVSMVEDEEHCGHCHGPLLG